MRFLLMVEKKERLQTVRYILAKDKELENLLHTVQILKKERDFLKKAASQDRTVRYIELNNEIEALKEEIKEETTKNKTTETQMKEVAKKLERINTYPDELKEFRVLGEEHRIFYEQAKDIQSKYDILVQNRTATETRLESVKAELIKYPSPKKEEEEVQTPDIDYEPMISELRKQIETIELQKRQKEAETHRRLADLEEKIQQADQENKRLLPLYREKEQKVRILDSSIKHLKRRIKSSAKSSSHLAQMVEIATFNKEGEFMGLSPVLSDMSSWSIELES
jgi:DNA repair exonuclease SbcCD ATPase subunit